ncbi:MAG: ATP-binding protein [Rhodocyclaceae bacterium]|nr:ATP-binding protein [Rhodocyclaceae bacterium]MDZ4214518.1 ATP-binding protein [Rhodocyclaceae bacterium]
MSHISFSQRWIALVLALVLLVGSWLAAFGFMLWRLREDSLRNGFATATTHARNFEEHLTQTLQVIDLTAGSIDTYPNRRVDYAELGQRLTIALRPAPFLRSISLIDASGQIVASSNPDNLGVNVGVEAFFPPVPFESEVLRVGMPWRGRDFADGKAATTAFPVQTRDASFIPVLRRLSTSENLRLVAALNPDYFINHGIQLIDAAAGHIQWLRHDGILLMSSAPGETPAIHGAAGAVTDNLRQREQGELAQTLTDGRSVLSAYRVSSRFPVLVVIHLDEAQILSNWKAEARYLFSIVLPIVVALAIAIMLIWVRQRRIAAQQQELERQRRLAASVFDASSESIILTTPDGDIISVNPAFERVTGYTSNEVIGRNPRLLKSGLTPPETYEALWATITKGKSWRGELQNRRKNGEVFWEAVTISPVLDAQGQLAHYVAVKDDISDRKRQEVELRHAKEDAEAASLAKSQFLATMSHEIRTPMNGILGMAQLLLDSDLDEPLRNDYVRTILNSGQTLQTLLNDILDLSKVEAGKLTLIHAVFDPVQMLDEIASLFGGPAGQKGLAISVKWEGTPRRYWADPIRLRQMLSNLVSNAIKFTERGRITIEAGEVASEGKLARLRFSVTDTGTGIPKEKLSRLFQPFSQVDSSSTRQHGGTGLGLSIVRSLAALMNGEAGVRTEAGLGSQFWFDIQSERVDENAETRHLERALSSNANVGDTAPQALSIMLVEDNPTNQLVLNAMLGKHGHHVTCYEHGRLALDALIAGAQPDLVLMDCQMPVMDGFETTSAIRQWERDQGLPPLIIIALTAGAFQEDRQHCLDVGMNDFVTKPVDMSHLLDVIGQWASSTAMCAKSREK